MSDDQSAGIEPLISHEQAVNEYRRALNLFVGRGKRFTNEELAIASGVPERLIECLRSYGPGHPDYRKLHFGHLLSIASALGADFTSRWLKLCYQRAAPLGPLDHDAIADWAEGYQAKKLAAHRKDSECEEQLGPNELEDLNSTVIQFPGSAAA